MTAPEPADAVTHYAALLRAHPWLDDGLCLTVADTLDLDDAFTRYGGFPSGAPPMTAREMTDRIGRAYPRELALVFGDAQAGWVLLLESPGLEGAQPGVLSRLSATGTAASAYWNVNLTNRVSYARDGAVAATFDITEPDLVLGPAPHLLDPFRAGLPLDDPDLFKAAALAVLERITGVRIAGEMLARPHPVAVVVPFDRFDLGDPAALLDVRAPDIGALLAGAAPPRARRAARIAARAACVLTAIDTDPLVRAALAPNAAADRLDTDLRERARQTLARELRRHLALSGPAGDIERAFAYAAARACLAADLRGAQATVVHALKAGVDARHLHQQLLPPPRDRHPD